MGGLVSLKLSLVQVPLDPLNLAGACRPNLGLTRSPFSFSTVPILFSISSIHQEMVFIASSSSDINLLNCSFSILKWINSFSKHSCSASLLCFMTKWPLRSATTAKEEFILTSLPRTMTPVSRPLAESILGHKLVLLLFSSRENWLHVPMLSRNSTIGKSCVHNL